MSRITRTIWLLSLVSLFTDVSSEMLYPIMPLYLKTIGFTVFWIGLLEGAAEATAGLSKIYFGRLSDLSGKRMPFVQLGYSLSALSKPMLAVFTYVPWVFSARTLDRLGKGIRTGARDAVLSDESTPENRGAVFGFHRAFDTVGAATGPAIALVYLYFFPKDYHTLFFIAFGPALISILLTFITPEKKKERLVTSTKPTLLNSFLYWKQTNNNYRKLVLGLLFFGLMNSSDMFLLLVIKQKGFSDSLVLGAYIFYNLVFALASFPLGEIADKFGLKNMMVFGLVLFSVVYFGMAITTVAWWVFALFFLYGLYAAATDGISKALISNLVPKTETASAIGFYAGWNSICALLASALTGLIFYNYGVLPAFTISAAGTLLTAFYLLGLKPAKKS